MNGAVANLHIILSTGSAKLLRLLAVEMPRSGFSSLLKLLLLCCCVSLPGCFLCSYLPNDGADDLCNEIISNDGYPCQSYTVTTWDGFLLGLYRIPHGYDSEEKERALSKPPVFLQHGLLQGGDTWVLNARDQSLAYILADEGFDVWIGNGRGTRWSRGHVSYTKKDKEYWDWSWDELAAYDLPASLEYVYTTTGVKIFYVGHSQGTIMGLAAFTQNVVGEFVIAAALLSPITYLNHITSSFVKTAAHSYIEKLVKTMGLREFNLRNEVGVELMDRVCASKRVDCGDMLAAITGPNCCFNSSRIPYYLQYEPHSTSLKNLAHLAQMVRDGTFCKYNYGFIGNLQHYFRISPPAYDLSKIPAQLSLWMSWGQNDALADASDVAHTVAELRNQPVIVFLENYGHIDFILGVRAKQDLYDSMISFFRSQIGVAVT